ncbi:MAG TPA: response regulator, partial [Caulobacteraceae bacterium]|nr:response regulator [Caulobacteraceae bacterium]
MNILIVDDHAIVRDGLTRLLASDGDHLVRQAVDGREALSLAKTLRPDLIILDLNLPGLGGLELLRRLVQ